MKCLHLNTGQAFTFFELMLEFLPFFGVSMEYFGISQGLFGDFVLISFRGYNGILTCCAVQSNF
jgi:hypothetical protein